MEEQQINKKMIPGITYLKAFLPLLVVACHARPFGVSASMQIPLMHYPDWKDIFYVNILTIAVPAFFLISFYLFLHKRSENEKPFQLMWTRVRYFALLFLLWRVIFAVAGIGNIWVFDRGVYKNIYILLFDGADTLLYYLEHMIYYTVLLELFCLFTSRFCIKREKIAWILTGLSILLLLFFTYVSPNIIKFEALRHYSPVAFFPYIFIAVLLYERKGQIPTAWVLFLGVLGVILAIVEWRILPDALYLQNGHYTAIPSYARLSVVLITTAVFSAMLSIQRIPGRIVRALSGVSLYVYCFHLLIINTFAKEIEHPFYKFVFVLFLTYLLSFSCYWIKRLWRHHGKKDSHDIRK